LTGHGDLAVGQASSVGARNAVACAPGEPVGKWIVCGVWHILAVDIRLGEGAIWMAERHINHQFVDAAPKRSAAGLEVRGPQCLLWVVSK
jgi:hypothetical protein